MKNDISKLIKNYRLERGLTQKQLSEGICTQAIISKLEKGEINPSIEIFASLCKKLKIPGSEILRNLELYTKESDEFVFTKELQKIYYTKDYQTIDYFLNTVKYSDLSKRDQIYYQWLREIVNFFLKDKKEEAFDNLYKLYLSLSKEVKLYSRIVQSLADMSYHLKNYKDAITFYKQILADVLASQSTYFKVQCLQGLSQAYISMDDYTNALKYNSMEIDVLLNDESLFKLGEAFLQLSQIFDHQHLVSEAINNCQKAIHIFDITNQFYLKNSAISYLAELQDRL